MANRSDLRRAEFREFRNNRRVGTYFAEHLGAIWKVISD